MNDDEMRGCARASEVVLALETTYTGWELLSHLLSEYQHALRVSIESNEPSVRDQWHGRAAVYGAAYDRHAEKEALHAA